MNKVIFWNVDTQIDFILPEGKLYIKGAEKILPNLKLLTDYARKNKIKIVNTRDFHDIDDKELSNTPDFVNTFLPHCIEGTKGSMFVNETRPIAYYSVGNKKVSKKYVTDDYDIVIFKNEFDVFTGNKFTKEVLQILLPNTVVVYGVATNVCVNFAVKGLAKCANQILVVKDTIKELPNLPVEKIFEEWEKLGNVKLVTVKEIIGGRNEI